MDSKEINLLGNYYTTPLKTKFLIWVVKYLRPFVIVFQIPVVVLLFSKIYLTDKLIAINSSLQDKVSILKSLSAVEKEFSTVKEKADIYRNLKSQKYNPAQYYTLLNSNKPENLEIRGLLVEKGRINIYAFSRNPVDFAYLVKNISKNEKVTLVELVSAEFSAEDQGFIFVLNVFLQ